ncbi:DHA2 family metal-tetracycline-proton antiporter-like MFS transporter [Neobacillus niacini]|uniref:MFS transporter n=1 Tax=Neobacillus driksii TaxID=3035913 RepID=UPI00277ECB76|nr:MFS transporter [Neobacillus niacini]MDQ0975905.1 DHA2 family metal-tetracycline-proton antiporter-like MFS transporter [Neobacillus niacini]
MPSILTAPSKIESTVHLQENKLILIWSVTTLIVVMNTTMFNVALPFILKDLSLNSSLGSWLVSGYSIMFAISTLTFGRLSDFVPLSRLLLHGICLLGISSVIGFFSTNFFILLGVRILQAAGAGAVMGLSMIMAGRYIPLSRRGKAMAIIASAASLAFGLGPVLGGVITQYLGWNYLFVVTIFSVLSIPFFLKLLPNEVIKKGHFDLFGSILTGLSVTGLLLFLSTFSYGILLGTVVLFAVWWKYLNKTEEPFIPLTLLRNKQYTKLLLINCSAFFINFSNLFLMPIILTTVFGKEPAELGMIIFPGAVIAVVAGIYIGRLIDRFGNAPLIIFGQLLLLSASILFAWFSSVNPHFILFIYMFASVGFTAISSSISNEITRILPINQIGSGIGIVQLMQFFGAGLGVTISGLLITIQEGLSLEIVYRNIFICFSIINIMASFIYSFYLRRARLKEQS